jgi:hypothetical protein
MKEMLKGKLWSYIVHNNPDLVIRLQGGNSVFEYLEGKVNAIMQTANHLPEEGKPLYQIEEWCMNEMTEDLKPSRYRYILSVIEEEFPKEYECMKANGTLTYETINMIEACKDIFAEFDFNVENEDNRHLRYAITGQVHDYLL